MLLLLFYISHYTLWVHTSNDCMSLALRVNSTFLGQHSVNRVCAGKICRITILLVLYLYSPSKDMAKRSGRCKKEKYNNQGESEAASVCLLTSRAGELLEVWHCSQRACKHSTERLRQQPQGVRGDLTCAAKRSREDSPDAGSHYSLLLWLYGAFGAGWMPILTFATKHSDKSNFNSSAPWLF